MAKIQNNDDPLTELLVDASEVDKRAIADALKGKLAIDAKTGRLLLISGFNALDSRKKLIAVLLGRKAAHLLGLIDPEGISNKDIAGATGLPPGTVAPSLKSLRELRLVGQDTEKGYLIPNPQLGAAITFLAGGS